MSQGGADSLLLGVEIKGVMSHLTSPARLLVAAKGQRRIEDIVAVDPNGTRLQLPCQHMRLADIPAPDPGRSWEVPLVMSEDLFW
jgi:hypothetical protein